MLILLGHDKKRVFCIKTKKMYKRNLQVGPPLSPDSECLFNTLSAYLTQHRLQILHLISTLTANNYSLEAQI